ncbi:MAG: alpha/beta hydrolase [Candidatus Omnitrophica bacterium]|nr:alpha/beta hydrolase [Candidatus Omnitrophota bacterium]
MKIFFVVVITLVLFRVYFIFLEQKSLYYPAVEVSETPAEVGIGYEELSFKTSDGEILNGWYVPAKDAETTVLYCHGNAGNICHRLHKVKFFNEMGVNFFIFDYRGYGKSSGRPGEKGLYNDAIAAFDYLMSRKDVDKSKIVMYGKSLGGPIAAEVCLRRKVSALILESSFASVVIRAQQIYPFLPMKFLISQKYDALDKIKNIDIPKLIVHGRNDEVIAFNHGQILFDAAGEPKQFLPFEGGHNDEVYVTSDEYRKKLEEFFAQARITHMGTSKQ